MHALKLTLFFYLCFPSACAAKDIYWKRTIGGEYFFDVTLTSAGELIAARAFNPALFRSTNEGQTWTQIPFVQLPLFSTI